MMNRFLIPLASILLLCACETKHELPALKFFVIGDWGRMGSPNQKVVAFQMNEWMKTDNPRFIVSTGDNFYNVGVKDINDPHWQESFEKVYRGDNLILKPWHVSVGNHDYYGNVDAEIEYSKISSRWKLPSRYYSFVEQAGDGSRVRFIFIDTSPFESSHYQDPNIRDKVLTQDTLRQKQWLDSLSSLNDVDWKIVVGHHHIYTGGLRKNEVNSVRKSLEPLFVKNKIDIYFCGHEHDLQYLKALDRPTHYFLSGSGSDIRPTGMINESLFAAAELGFMSVSVNRKTIEVKVIDYNGKELYLARLEH